MKIGAIYIPLLAGSLLFGSTQAHTALHSYPSSSGMKCKLEQVKDTEQSGLVAFTYFVPDGWTAHNHMHWIAPGAFTANLSASTPDKHYSASQLQRFIATFSSARNMPPQGIVIHQATDFLHALLNQIKSQYGVDDVQVVDEINEPLPLSKQQETSQRQYVDPLGSRNQVSEQGFLEVKFQMNGVETTAALGTTISGAISSKHMLNRPDQTIVESGVFAIGPTTVVVAPSEAPSSKIKELQLVVSSMSETPQFLAFWRALGAHLANDFLKGTEIGQKEYDAHWHERAMAQFRGQMDSKDANTHQFCNYILNQQDYKTPGGSVVALPSTCKHVWADGQGDYFMTDDPTADASGLGGGKWQEMAKARLGD